MRNILLEIEYDGSAYAGWQSQKNAKSVQNEVCKALSPIFGEVKLIGSGRTDAGVHAVMQCANFLTDNSIALERIRPAINFYLPNDIAIKRVSEVDEHFHSRFSAKSKTYIYKFWISDSPSPLHRRTHWVINSTHCTEKMNSFAKLFEGEHNFSAFCAKATQDKNTVRTIFSACVQREGNEARFIVRGNGFLYNMVRIMARLLIDASTGMIDEQHFKELLKGGERSLIKGLAPPNGLYLFNVEY